MNELPEMQAMFEALATDETKPVSTGYIAGATADAGDGADVETGAAPMPEPRGDAPMSCPRFSGNEFVGQKSEGTVAHKFSDHCASRRHPVPTPVEESGLVIDIPRKTEALIALLKDSLPIRARTTPRLVASLRERSPGGNVPLECDVVEVFYAGDEGGIMCSLDFGDRATTDVHIVSITHLAFDRTVRMVRDIEAYQRHRIKKIRRQQNRDS